MRLKATSLLRCAVTKRHQPPHLQGCVPTYSSRAETSLNVPSWSLKARHILEWSMGDLVPTNDFETGMLFPSPRNVQCPGPSGAAAVSGVTLSSITCTAGQCGSH